MYGTGGNEYGQCGEEPEKKDETGRVPRRDIAIPQRCAPKLIVRQVICLWALGWCLCITQLLIGVMRNTTCT